MKNVNVKWGRKDDRVMETAIFNGPCVTSGPNGPEPNDNRLLQENGCPCELCFFKVLLKFCAEFNRKKTASKKINFCRKKKIFET